MCELEQESQNAFDFTAWFAEIEAIREQIRVANDGVFPSIYAVGTLREIRNGDDE